MEAKVTDSFDRIMQGLQEAAEHARGADVPGLVLHVPEKGEPGEVDGPDFSLSAPWGRRGSG
jgi:hypothetical protein